MCNETMEEKFEAIWNQSRVDHLKKIYEVYNPETEKLHVIYLKDDGTFMPEFYSKESDFQWRLPIWSQQNENAIMPTIDSAKEYLEAFAQNYT